MSSNQDDRIQRLEKIVRKQTDVTWQMYFVLRDLADYDDRRIKSAREYLQDVDKLLESIR